MKFRDPNVEMPSSGKLNELLHSSVRWCGNKLLDDCFEEPMITINNVKASGLLCMYIVHVHVYKTRRGLSIHLPSTL